MVFCYSISGYHGHIVSVEVNIRRGLPGIDIIGLPGSEIRESRERMRVAIGNSGFQYPGGRITVNLAPADVPKNGVAFDLAIATAILQASGQLSSHIPCSLLVLGELKLAGNVDSVRGVISAVDEARILGINFFLVPAANYKEASSLSSGFFASVSHLSELATPHIDFKRPSKEKNAVSAPKLQGADFSDYQMDEDTHKALQVAAAGFHHSIFMGPPGMGKTMAARRLPSLLDSLSLTESIEVTRIYSIVDIYDGTKGLIQQRPVRIPHHSATLEGMIGGGKHIVPGEISLAHGGVLILDEATEFKPKILQALREPLELNAVHISRATKKYRFPANFQLLLTVNKCPCGNYTSRIDPCLCSRAEIFQYWKRFGAALMDRVDVRIDFQHDTVRRFYQEKELRQSINSVRHAIAIQRDRYATKQYRWNSRMPVSDISIFCRLDRTSELSLEREIKKYKLTLRGRYAVLRIARTIADIAQRPTISEEDILTAVKLRSTGEFSRFL